MFFKQIYEDGLAQASYIIGCQETKQAIVIDPRRDIDIYLDISEKENLEITHVSETHIHADFLSGSRELAAATNAEIYLSDEGGEDWKYNFTHTGLKHGDKIKLGNIELSVLHTPGHTPEHIAFLITDKVITGKPLMLLTGDYVFVGDVGRPDLLEKAAGISGTQEISAKQMFESLKLFKSLPDYIQVWPGHGAGSACGKALGAVPSSTVGYEKITNWAMKINDVNEFVDLLLKDQPEPPKYFKMMKKLNKFGPTVLGGIPHPAKLSLPQLREAVEKNTIIIDTRDKFSFAGGHIKGSLNIQDNSAFSTWAGWMLHFDEPFVLIAKDDRIVEITKELVRIGYSHFYGYITGLDRWANHCNELEVMKQISVKELLNKIDDSNLEIIDVRSYTEFNEGYIPSAKNIHAGYLTDNLELLPKEKDLIVYCGTGDRSAIAASVLMRYGFTNVYNLTGGYQAWQNEGFPVMINNKDN